MNTINDLRDHFGILKTTVHDKPLVYLDNAATMQMPEEVLTAVTGFYRGRNANIHRGIHTLSENATEEYEGVREKVRAFLGAEDKNEIIFTSGTTASVNVAAEMIGEWVEAQEEQRIEELIESQIESRFKPSSRRHLNVIVSGMEHHSNLLPWQALTKRKQLNLKIIPVKDDGQLDMEAFQQMISENTVAVAFAESSNVTGIRNPVEELIRLTRQKSNAWILVDGAQGAFHCRTDLSKMKPDFYCFSGHKLGAPTGTGVLFIRKERQNELRPAWYGGGTVYRASYEGADFYEGTARFEPGTPNYSGVIGLGAALDFWARMDEEFGQGFLERHEQTMLAFLEKELAGIPQVHVPGAAERRYGCLSFAADTLHAYDLCKMLDQYGIAVRSGHMCAQPYINALGFEHVVRVSVAPYNTEEEIRYFVECLKDVLAVAAYRSDISNSRKMSMHEVEEDIEKDLADIGSPMGQYSFLIACAEETLPFPERFRKAEYLVPSCQVNTWVATEWIDGRCVLYADSESVIVKGVLALLQEIWMDRTEEEIEAYACGLIESELIKKHLNKEQVEGLREIVSHPLAPLK